jgi:hypothetical protein
MPSTQTDHVHGQTMRWTWTEGPTKGKTHEHTFNEDGTVVWHAVKDGEEAVPVKPGKQAGSDNGERARYAVFQVTDDVSAVSYLADSGYTLSVVLNFADQKIVGFASNSQQWYPVKGKFEIVGPTGTVH